MAVYKAPDIQWIITQRNQALMNKTVLFFFPSLMFLKLTQRYKKQIFRWSFYIYITCTLQF